MTVPALLILQGSDAKLYIPVTYKRQDTFYSKSGYEGLRTLYSFHRSN